MHFGPRINCVGHGIFTNPYRTPLPAQHFDLVLNGVELGGGSIRIHNGPMQRRVLEILGEETGEMVRRIVNLLVDYNGLRDLFV